MEIWSGIRGSNSRPIPWQGIALPTELIPHVLRQTQRSLDLRLDQSGSLISEELNYASILLRFARVLRTFITHVTATRPPYTCRHSPGGEIGRHSGLKIRRRQNVVPVRVGSGAPSLRSSVSGTAEHSMTWEGQRHSSHAIIFGLRQAAPPRFAHARLMPTFAATTPDRAPNAQAKRESTFMDSLCIGAG